MLSLTSVSLQRKQDLTFVFTCSLKVHLSLRGLWKSLLCSGSNNLLTSCCLGLEGGGRRWERALTLLVFSGTNREKKNLLLLVILSRKRKEKKIYVKNRRHWSFTSEMKWDVVYFGSVWSQVCIYRRSHNFCLSHSCHIKQNIKLHRYLNLFDKDSKLWFLKLATE